MTAPDPLAPDQHDGPATDRQVTDPDRAAAMELGSYPTALTADHGGRGLDLELPLAGYDLRGEDRKAVQAEQPGRRGTTVLTHLGPPSCRRHASASYARSQVLFRRLLGHPQQGTAPRFMTKSRHTGPGRAFRGVQSKLAVMIGILDLMNSSLWICRMGTWIVLPQAAPPGLAVNGRSANRRPSLVSRRTS
jgi:hypothetical protein